MSFENPTNNKIRNYNEIRCTIASKDMYHTTNYIHFQPYYGIGCNIGVMGSGKTQLQLKWVETFPRSITWDKNQENRKLGIKNVKIISS